MSLAYSTKVNGAHGLKVSGRTKTGAGPYQLVTGKVKAEKTYKVSAQVQYREDQGDDNSASYPEEKEFLMTIRYGDGSNVNMGRVTVKKGEWGTITGTYSIPSDADLSDVRIFIETPWTSEPDSVKDLMTFYLDDVSMKEDVPVILNGGFESGQENWSVNGDAELSLGWTTKYEGNHSLKVSNRQSTGSGPMQEVTGKVEAGQEYKLSARIYYDEGTVTSQTFNICIWNGDKIEVMASGQVNKGNWGLVEGSYTIPSDADLSKSRVFVETAYKSSPEADDLISFYVDEVSMEEKDQGSQDTPDSGTTPKLMVPTGNLSNDFYTLPDSYDIKNNSIEYCNTTSINYPSKKLGTNRHAYVLLPPGYSKSKSYPVLYLLNGLLMWEGMWTDNDAISTIYGNMYAKGQAKEMIIVCVGTRVSTTPEDQGSAFGAENCKYYDDIRDELIDSLIPYMIENYNVKAGRENTAVAGFSMGGREALYCGLSRSDVFGYCAAYCPAPGVSDELLKGPNGENKNNTVIMIGRGLSDGTVGNIPKEYHEKLQNNGISHYFYEVQGAGHDYNVYYPGFYYFAKTLFKY